VGCVDVHVETLKLAKCDEGPDGHLIGVHADRDIKKRRFVITPAKSGGLGKDGDDKSVSPNTRMHMHSLACEVFDAAAVDASSGGPMSLAPGPVDAPDVSCTTVTPGVSVDRKATACKSCPGFGVLGVMDSGLRRAEVMSGEIRHLPGPLDEQTIHTTMVTGTRCVCPSEPAEFKAFAGVCPEVDGNKSQCLSWHRLREARLKRVCNIHKA
jgi:hypothetical protein